jgi:hypothetical protein
MVAPVVVVESETVCADEYVPPAGENEGITTAGGCVVPEATVRLSSWWSWTWTPQHFTCRIWLPGGADTWTVKDVGTTVVGP